MEKCSRELNLMNCQEPTRLLSFLYGTGEVRLGPNFFYRFSAFWLRSSVVSVLISLISDLKRSLGLPLLPRLLNHLLKKLVGLSSIKKHSKAWTQKSGEYCRFTSHLRPTSPDFGHRKPKAACVFDLCLVFSAIFWGFFDPFISSFFGLPVWGHLVAQSVPLVGPARTARALFFLYFFNFLSACCGLIDPVGWSSNFSCFCRDRKVLHCQPHLQFFERLLWFYRPSGVRLQFFNFLGSCSDC